MHGRVFESSADFDDDGDVDFFVANDSVENHLWENLGGLKFRDAGVASGTAVNRDGMPQACMGIGVGDIEREGRLDLFVTNYVDFTPDNNKHCTAGPNIRTYCHPNVYNSLPDVLYRNNGDGTFSDVTKEAGIYRKDGKGLGVVFGDYDNDGWTDIFVANDSDPNFLFHNKGKGIFEEVGFWAGVAVGGEGRPLAGMGTDMGDINGDGLLDIFVTNLDRETHSLYRNQGKGLFSNVTFPAEAMP